MKHLDLFSGIGGFALAAQWAGIETVAFCEIDKFCHKVLQKNFPRVPIHDDIRTLRGEDYAGIDIITGGYPCQPFSLAGKRKGSDDERHLWPEMFRLVREIKPRWVVGENVAGHITSGLDDVCDDLESENYETRTFVFPAFAVGAKHGRERVFVVANSKSKRRNYGHDCENERKADRTEYPSANHSGAFGRMETGRWAPEPNVGRVVDGVPNRVDRNRGLGNAVVPQVAYEILRCIRAV